MPIKAAAAILLCMNTGEPFPGRALIQSCAFTVAVDTLLLQWANLPALARRLRLPHEAPSDATMTRQ